jgi:hypothetical protein
MNLLFKWTSFFRSVSTATSDSALHERFMTVRLRFQVIGNIRTRTGHEVVTHQLHIALHECLDIVRADNRGRCRTRGTA